MRTYLALVAACLAVPALAAPAQAGADLPLPGPASVVLRDCRAIDGDTLRCGAQRIRLLGIDAAELPGHCRVGRHCAPGDPYAQTRALQRAVTSQLSVRIVARDRYRRLVAQMRNAAGVDLSCAMLAAGATYRADWDNGGLVGRTCGRR